VRLATWLSLPLILCTACVANPRVEQPEKLPPIVTRQRQLAEDAGDKALQAALETYKNDAAILQLVDSIRRYSSAPLTTGNRVSILIDGPQTYSALEAALRAARHDIHIETFIFGAGDVGQRFADLLAQKRKQGVEVRVLYDSLGSRETPREFFEQLRQQDIEVREFRPWSVVKTPDVWNLHNRDHRKIIVVDGKVGFTGGINIDSTYASASTSKPGPERGLEDGWRDTHIEIEGPVVAQLQNLFFESWQQAGPPENLDKKDEYFPRIAPAGHDLVTVVANDSESDDRSLYGTYLAAFKSSTRRLWLTHAYFAPNEELLTAMIDAAQRGVDVRLIVPSFTDSRVVLNATQATFTRLLKAGVRIYELKDALLHAKSVVVDSAVSIVGSANLDMRSFLHNDEVNAIVIGRDTARRMEEVFLRDQQAARPVDLKSWQRRSLWQRTKEFFVNLFSYWI
jgi:cardiolipin synthase A/B